MSIIEQVILSRRIRAESVPEWGEFFRLWAAFNCLYGEETGGERDRVMRVVQKYLSSSSARILIEQTAAAACKLTELPPGNMRMDLSDPQFRAQTKRCVDAYSDLKRPCNERLAGLMGAIYQVRCNLLHGDKDPDDTRDKMLILNSITVLGSILPALEKGILESAQHSSGA